MAAKVALSLGVAKTAIITLTKPRDTQEEGFEVKRIVGKQPFLLVTSANHMARAERFFLARNMQPITAPPINLPLPHHYNLGKNFSHRFTFFPTQNALGMSSLA